MMKKLSQRQLEVLRAISLDISDSGLPPTIVNLRTKLKLNSDQGVIELLNRLESAGYIKRMSGKARGLKLLPSAYVALGLPTKPVQEDAQNANSLILNANQKFILDGLQNIDEKLSGMYLGGLKALLDKANPEYIVFSAHAMREIIDSLANIGSSYLSPEEKEADKSENRRKKLVKYIDPLNGVTIKVSNTIYSRAIDFYQKFSKIAHHLSFPTDNEFDLVLSDFEVFLKKYILPLQNDIYNQIDEIIKLGPAVASSKELVFLITRNAESFRYFFDKVDEKWFDFLLKEKLLQPYLDTAQYLRKVAAVAPVKVMNVILTYQSRDYEDDRYAWRLLDIWIDAANQMPPYVGKKIITKIKEEGWLKKFDSNLTARSAVELLKSFIIKGQYKSALYLSALLLEIKPDVNLSSARGFIPNYLYQETLKAIMAIPPTHILPFIDLLSTTLLAAIHKARDYTFAFRPAIETHEQNGIIDEPVDLLVDSVRDLTETYIAHALKQPEKNAAEALKNLFKQHIRQKIVIRIKLYLYSRFPKEFLKEIRTTLKTKLTSTDTWHEYAVILRNNYSSLSEPFKIHYLQQLDSILKSRNKRAASFAKKALNIIHDMLPSQYKIRYKKILQEKEDFADFIVFSRSYDGPKSPIKPQEMALMTVPDVISYLCNTKFEKDHHHYFDDIPTIEGVLQVFRSDAEGRIMQYSLHAEKFANPQIDLAFTSNFLLALNNCIEGTAPIDWSKVFVLLNSIIKSVKLDGTFRDTLQNTVRLLNKALNHVGQNTIPQSYANDIIEILLFLCEYPDPEVGKETYGKNDLDPYTRSINSVRGEAFHALFNYILWLRRHSQIKEFIIPEAVRKLLLRHLDYNFEKSLAIRSVYGWYLPYLYYSDQAWVGSIIELIFPKDKPDLFFAAWETYLSRLDKSLFNLLEDQYKFALDTFRTTKIQRPFWINIHERLIEHILKSYIHSFNDQTASYKDKLLQLCSLEEKAHGISYLGRAYIQSKNWDKVEPATRLRLSELWEERLLKSSDIEELKEFAHWVRADFFDNEWLLNSLIRTLELTSGVVAEEFTIIKMLEKLTPQYPFLCSQVLQMTIEPIRLGNDTAFYVGAHLDRIKNILLQIYRSKDGGAISQANKVIDHLMKLGYQEFRSLNTQTCL